MALLARARTGRGQLVDVGMLDSTAALLTYQAGNYFATGKHPGQARQPASDNRPVRHVRGERRRVSLSPSATTRSGAPSARTCGLDEMARDPRFATNPQRVAAYAEVTRPIAELMKTRTRAEWIAVLSAAGVPCGAVRSVGEVLEDPHLASREMIQEVEHAAIGAMRVLGIPAKLSDTPGTIRSAPPALGQHTDEILGRDLGLSASQIAALREAKAI